MVMCGSAPCPSGPSRWRGRYPWRVGTSLLGQPKQTTSERVSWPSARVSAPNPQSRARRAMFRHTDYMQFDVKPEKPDPVYARKLQELLGGAYGEMTVTMQYLMQGWNCRM